MYTFRIKGVMFFVVAICLFTLQVGVLGETQCEIHDLRYLFKQLGQLTMKTEGDIKVLHERLDQDNNRREVLSQAMNDSWAQLRDLTKTVNRLEAQLENITSKVHELLTYIDILENKIGNISAEHDINECESSPCKNGATCKDEVKTYTCDCLAGFTGINCETGIDECDSAPCENGGTCNNLANAYTCDCVDGFTGVICEINVDECGSAPCENGGTCHDLANAYTCDCVDGFTGVICEITTVSSHVGRRFVTAFLQHTERPLSLQLLIACAQTANVSISIPFLNISNEQYFCKDSLTLTFDNTLMVAEPTVISSKAIHVLSSRPVTLFTFVYNVYSVDGTLVLPESTLGTQYIMSSYFKGWYQAIEQFIVVGTTDNTAVQLNVSSVQSTISLNRMQVYMGTSENLTGSMISASAPVYVASGHSCAIHPSGGACDYIVESMPPLNLIGKVYVVCSMSEARANFDMSIAAPFETTLVTIYDSAGNVLESIGPITQTTPVFRTYTGFTCISIVSSEQILVTQYGHGATGEARKGDPSMMFINSIDHYASRYEFVVPSGLDVSVLVLVMSSHYATSDVRLNSGPIDPTAVNSLVVPGSGIFSALYCTVNAGFNTLSHTDSSIVKFGAWLIGFSTSAEYAWSLGMS